MALLLDGRAWLRIEPEALPELGLVDGEIVDEERRTALEIAVTRVRARLFLVRSLAVRMQSRSELERKLAAQGVPGHVAQEALERVAEYGYLDDEALAGQLARGMCSRGYGRRRAQQKLRERGLSGPLAEAALAEAYGEQDEAALARASLGRRPVGDERERKRALAYLARRGFSTHAARAAVRAAAAGAE